MYKGSEKNYTSINSKEKSIVNKIPLVLVLMSTYNGGDRIKRQIGTILTQRFVNVHILIRDDGSENETLVILKALQQKNPERITLKLERNIGWIKSFQKLLHYPETKGYDFYAFSDQDDVWKNTKLIKCIDTMISDKHFKGPKICQCNSITSDELLKELPEQEIHYASPVSRKMCIAQEYFRGCSMVWNQELMKLIHRYRIKNSIPHDYWVGVLGYYFGKIYYYDSALFYHIRFMDSSSGDGDLRKARLGRLRLFFRSDSVYYNPSMDLLEGYSNLLEDDDKLFLENLSNCKYNFASRMKIFCDKEFRRESKASTVLLKISVLLGKY